MQAEDTSCAGYGGMGVGRVIFLIINVAHPKMAAHIIISKWTIIKLIADSYSRVRPTLIRAILWSDSIACTNATRLNSIITA